MGLFFKKKNNINEELGNFNLRHIIGLDIPERTCCKIIIYSDKLLIKSSDKEYSLKIEKIHSIDFDMDLDIEKYTKSSKVKGLVGAATLGVSGAIIGSAPKTKEKRSVTCKAVISYEDSLGDTSYMIFEDLEVNAVKGAAKLVDTLRPMIKKQKVKEKIEL
ncbi:hypothetical protein [Clostridium butanoliproducens]|uniref:hypothetical protein n=1 Tax=Clostridium butanoliproducens TaxID=2991837 RepID=UPI0024BA6FD5|nr:hypothetical protein [Clostridium butanoliproducens]MDU1348267.1 hypothetical protein [Clostridium argentinense]